MQYLMYSQKVIKQYVRLTVGTRFFLDVPLYFLAIINEKIAPSFVYSHAD